MSPGPLLGAVVVACEAPDVSEVAPDELAPCCRGSGDDEDDASLPVVSGGMMR